MARERGAGAKGSGRRRRRQKDKEFMDAALDGFIRDQALHLWRDFEIYRARPGTGAAEALAAAGFFEDKQPYAALWSAQWSRITVPAEGLSDGELYGRMEGAVRAAVIEERETRQKAGDRLLEDLDEYNEFIRRALGGLLAEDTAGEGRSQ